MITIVALAAAIAAAAGFAADAPRRRADRALAIARRLRAMGAIEIRPMPPIRGR